MPLREICDWGTDQKGGGGEAESSADQVQTKKAPVSPVYPPALCLDGVAATARLSLDDLGDRAPPLGAGVLHTNDCAGRKDLEGWACSSCWVLALAMSDVAALSRALRCSHHSCFREVG